MIVDNAHIIFTLARIGSITIINSQRTNESMLNTMLGIVARPLLHVLSQMSLNTGINGGLRQVFQVQCFTRNWFIH